MNSHVHIELIVHEIRQKMRALWTKKKIIDNLCKNIPHDVLFICYKAAEIMESDYGRPRD
jgi:hypothetical protein